MKIYPILLCLIAFIGVFIPYLCLRHTRNKADYIILWKKPPTPARMNRYIRVLTLSSILLFGIEQERDLYRIDKLLDMLKEMQDPHG